MPSPKPPSPGPPSPETLISLLTDPSRKTQKAVLTALEDLGTAAWPPLVRAAEGDDPALRARARQAQLELARRSGRQSLRAHLEEREDREPLLHGLLAIDEILGFRMPSAPGAANPVGEALSRWVDEFDQLGSWREGPALAAAGALRRVLAENAGLGGVDEDFHNLQNVSLTRTVERRCGLPLTLSAIYATVARRCGLPAFLLPFPGQVLLGLGDEGRARIILDPFRGGALVSHETCDERLARMGAPASPEWLRPASDRAMLVRQTRNLSAAMLRHGREQDARMFARLSAEFT